MDIDKLPSTSGAGSDSAAAAAPQRATADCDDRTRFVVELEFVQCLANPLYLNWLAQNRYLDDPSLLNYLKYLDYWRQPQYARYIKYPHCLLMLELLQDEQFRKAIALPHVADDIHTQQFYHWQHYRSNRVKEGTASMEGLPAAAAGAPAAPALPAAAAAAAAAAAGPGAVS